eukprot:1195168-Prorocentrum_minimum.AAC.1
MAQRRIRRRRSVETIRRGSVGQATQGAHARPKRGCSQRCEHREFPGEGGEGGEGSRAHTDTTNVHTDTTNVHTDTPNVHGDAPNVPSDTPDVHTDTPNVHGDAPNVHSDTPNVRTAAPNVHSDTPNVHAAAPNVLMRAPVSRGGGAGGGLGQRAQRGPRAKGEGGGGDCLAHGPLLGLHKGPEALLEGHVDHARAHAVLLVAQLHQAHLRRKKTHHPNANASDSYNLSQRLARRHVPSPSAIGAPYGYIPSPPL